MDGGEELCFFFVCIFFILNMTSEDNTIRLVFSYTNVACLSEYIFLVDALACLTDSTATNESLLSNRCLRWNMLFPIIDFPFSVSAVSA